MSVGVACVLDTLSPPDWESMDYNTFLVARRERMAELMHVAFRKLGGESGSVPLAPPWFLPGADAVWKRITETERMLREAVREVYTARFGERAPERIEAALTERERETLTRALRSRPPGAEPIECRRLSLPGPAPTPAFRPMTPSRRRALDWVARRT